MSAITGLSFSTLILDTKRTTNALASVLSHIFSYLNPSDLDSVMRVSRSWKALVTSNRQFLQSVSQFVAQKVALQSLFCGKSETVGRMVTENLELRRFNEKKELFFFSSTSQLTILDRKSFSFKSVKVDPFDAEDDEIGFYAFENACVFIWQSGYKVLDNDGNQLKEKKFGEPILSIESFEMTACHVESGRFAVYYCVSDLFNQVLLFNVNDDSLSIFSIGQEICHSFVFLEDYFVALSSEESIQALAEGLQELDIGSSNPQKSSSKDISSDDDENIEDPSLKFTIFDSRNGSSVIKPSFEIIIGIDPDDDEVNNFCTVGNWIGYRRSNGDLYFLDVQSRTPHNLEGCGCKDLTSSKTTFVWVDFEHDLHIFEPKKQEPHGFLIRNDQATIEVKILTHFVAATTEKSIKVWDRYRGNLLLSYDIDPLVTSARFWIKAEASIDNTFLFLWREPNQFFYLRPVSFKKVGSSKRASGNVEGKKEKRRLNQP